MDAQYEVAADAIAACDFLLIAAGAGFSADSGLPTYASAVYNHEDMDYGDVCRPFWITENPSVFYGFWERCTRMYTQTQPHEGYRIIHSWLQFAACRESSSARIDALQHQHLFKHYADMAEDIPKNFYVYTSNVDGHFRQIVPRNCMSEIHGSVHEWQCAKPCCPQLIKLDDLLPQVLDSSIRNIRCPQCNSASLRPHVMMFGDDQCIVTPGMHERYQTWECAVENVLRDHADAKLCIVELGCGVKVPSIREECELVVADVGSQATLVRINPDHPEGPSNIGDRLICVQDTGLNACRRISKVLERKHGWVLH
jgi:NAD-dependent SIR2 family protein deacetylase